MMGEIDLKYNTSLLNEEPDSDKIQKIIGEEISNLAEKNIKKDVVKLVGRLVWSSVFERYCPKFYLLMEDGFNIPDNFEEYLIESLNPNPIKVRRKSLKNQIKKMLRVKVVRVKMLRVKKVRVKMLKVKIRILMKSKKKRRSQVNILCVKSSTECSDLVLQ